MIKEAAVPLGHLKSEAAAKVLTTRLAEFEAMLVRKDISLYPMEEMQKVLDRLTASGAWWGGGSKKGRCNRCEERRRPGG